MNVSGGREAMCATTHSSESASEYEAELRRLRKRLADAWWDEEPLERIEQLELAINRCRARLNPGT